MNNLSRLPIIIALTLALAACGDDKNPDYGSMGADGGNGALPDTDKVNGNNGDASLGMAPGSRGNFNPENVDNQTLASDTIYFDFDKSTIGADERGKLDQVSQWFKANPGHQLFLAGHADKRGTPEYNRALGEKRALAVREYLAGLGIPAASLYTNSYGSDRPAVDGDTEEAYAKNRRVEIGVVVQKP